jgi:hypothetical protein
MWTRLSVAAGIALLLGALVLLVVFENTTAAFWSAVVGFGISIRGIGDYIDSAGTTTAKGSRLRYEGGVIGLIGVGMIAVGIAALAGLIQPQDGTPLGLAILLFVGGGAGVAAAVGAFWYADRDDWLQKRVESDEQ